MRAEGSLSGGGRTTVGRMPDAKVSFARPVLASLRVTAGWALVSVRSIETQADGRLSVTLAEPYDGRKVWVCNHASLRSVDKRIQRITAAACGNAVGAGVSRILRQIADGVDGVLRGEDPQ